MFGEHRETMRDAGRQTGGSQAVVAQWPGGGDGDGHGSVPPTLASGESPGPSRPGSKYPVRGISHPDDTGEVRSGMKYNVS